MSDIDVPGAHAAGDDRQAKAGPPGTAMDREERGAAEQEQVGGGPAEVVVGGGGDPTVFGLPVFVSGSLVLGFALIGAVPIPDSLGSVLAITTFSTGLGEAVTAAWAIALGQTMVAAIFGLFAGFWFSLMVMLTGTFHGWFAVPEAQFTPTFQMFFLAWLIIFVFLTIATLRLPVSYFLIMAFVDLTVLFVLLALVTGVAVFFVIAGICALAFCAIGLYAFLSVSSTSTGAARPWVPLGPALVK